MAALPVTSPAYDIGLTEGERRKLNLRRLTGATEVDRPPDP
jgi:hypothetical protein